MCELKELKEGGLDFFFCSAPSGRNYGLWIRLNVKTISGVFVSLVCLHFFIYSNIQLIEEIDLFDENAFETLFDFKYEL